MKALLKGLGLVCVALGFIGVFLPLLPTTPFLLLALFLFARSDPKWRERIFHHKILGPYVAGYATDAGIPMKAKLVTIAILWGTILISAIFFVKLWWVRLILLGVAIGVTIHVLMKKTARD